MADVLTGWDRWSEQIHAHLRDEFILPEQLAEDDRLLMTLIQTNNSVGRKDSSQSEKN